jgi:hypothetical protein
MCGTTTIRHTVTGGTDMIECIEYTPDRCAVVLERREEHDEHNVQSNDG